MNRIALSAALLPAFCLPLLVSCDRKPAAPAPPLPQAIEREAIPDPSRFVPPAGLAPERQEAARRAMQVHAEALEARYGAGDLASFEKLAIEALRLYQQAGWLFPELGHLHGELVQSRLAAGDHATVIRESKRWLELFPDSPRQMEASGIAEYLTGKYQDAAGHFEAYAAKRPQSLVTQRQLCDVYAAIGIQDKAIQAVDRSLELVGFPGGGFREHPEGEKTLWKALRTVHRFRDYTRLESIAAALYEQPAARKEPELLMALGVAKRNRGDLDGAVDLLGRFLQLEPADSPNAEPVRLELAMALLKLARPGDALREMAGLLAANPASSRGYFQLSQCLERLGRGETAAGMFRMSRAMAPIDRELRREEEQRGAGRAALALRARARACFLQGRYRKGEEAFRDERSAEDPAAQVYRIEYLLMIYRVPEARLALRKLGRQIGEGQADVRGWSAAAMRLEGEVEKAAAIWADLCRERSRLQVWGLHLCRALLEDLRRPAEAALWLDALLAEAPDTRARILLGRAYSESSRPEPAIRTLEEIPAQEEEWEEEGGMAWLALARLQAGRQAGDTWKDLEAAGTALSHRAEYHRARAGWLEKIGGPGAPEEARRESETAARLEGLDRRLIELRRAASTGTTPEAAGAALLEAARNRFEAGDRQAALQFARLAAAAVPDGGAGSQAVQSQGQGQAQGQAALPAWQTLAERLDRPEELFLRAEALRRIAAIDPSRQAPSLEELNAALSGRP